MLKRLADPLVRHAARQSFSWPRLLPMLPFALIEADRWQAPGTIGRLGLLALCFASPCAAAHLIELEHDGRLDQVRLSGRRPRDIAAALIAGAAGPWLVLGGGLTAIGMARAALPPIVLLQVAAVAGLTAALSVASADAYTKHRIDPRILLAGLGLVSLMVAVAGTAVVFPASQTPMVTPVVDAVISWRVWLLPGEAVVVLIGIRRITRRIARRPQQQSGGAKFPLLPALAALRRWPGLWRGTRLAVAGLVLCGISVPMVVLNWYLARPELPTPASVLAVSFPLLIGFVAIALICREEAMLGPFDLTRLSSRRTGVTALEAMAGLWIPFVAASALTALLALVLLPATARWLWIVPVVWLLVAPLPALEGWRRAWPAAYLLPVVIAVGASRVNGSELQTLLIVSFVVWAALIDLPRQPEGTPFGGWKTAAVAAVVAALSISGARGGYSPIAGWGFSALTTAIVLVALAPLLIDGRAATSIDRWGAPVAVVLVTTAAAAWAGMPIGREALWSMAPAAGWLVAGELERRLRRHLLVQAAARLALIVSLAMLGELLAG